MRAPSLLVLCAATLAAAPLRAQAIDARQLSALVWRNVGPFRGGRISAASGVIGQPGVFYVGTPEGGVWKTTSADRKSTRLNSSHTVISYAVFCLKKKKHERVLEHEARCVQVPLS